MKKSQVLELFKSFVPPDGSEIPYDEFREKWKGENEAALADMWGEARRKRIIAHRFEKNADDELVMFVGLPSNGGNAS